MITRMVLLWYVITATDSYFFTRTDESIDTYGEAAFFRTPVTIFGFQPLLLGAVFMCHRPG